MEEQTVKQEPMFRLNIKRNFKGELGYEYTVRADDIGTLTKLNDEVKQLAEKQIQVK